MRAQRATGRYRKDVRLARKRGWDLAKLNAVLDLLLAGKPLSAKHEDYPLTGPWRGCRDCHIEPDWLLIYRDNGVGIELVRTGSHADIFG
jgi:mRNA interferase YafQ